MITFHRDNLVPPELCKLLYDTVPEEYHVPVVFNNHPTHYTKEKNGHRFFGTCFWSYVEINLNPILGPILFFNGVAEETRAWLELLHTSYHEFGHIACPTIESAGAYKAHGREYHYTEGLADEWAGQRMLSLAEHDTRLCQPAQLGGYVGYRLAQGHYYDTDGWNSAKVQEVKRWRCYKTGGQYTSGDVLAKLSIRYNRNAYGLLRRVSAGLGIDYADSAGRHHKLYTWGDLPILAERLNRLNVQPEPAYKIEMGAEPPAGIWQEPPPPDVGEDEIPF